jgi:hypothetical protein
MFICAAILKYTENYQNSILSNTEGYYGLTISKIIKTQYREASPSLSDGLINYFSNRCRTTSTQLRAGNILGDESQISRGRLNWSATPTKEKSYTSIDMNSVPNIDQMLLERLQQMQAQNMEVAVGRRRGRVVEVGRPEPAQPILEKPQEVEGPEELEDEW